MKKIKFKNIKNNKFEEMPIDNFFYLAVVPPCRNFPNGKGHGEDPKVTGICVGISIKHKNLKEYVNFYKKLSFDNLFTVFVKDKNISIPVTIHGGNGYDRKKYKNTSCMFGYISLENFDKKP